MGTDLTPAIVAVCKEGRGEGRKETGNLPGNPFWAMSLRRLGMQARLARRLICPATCVPSGRLDSDVDRDSGWFQFLFLPADCCLLPAADDDEASVVAVSWLSDRFKVCRGRAACEI